MFDAKIVAACIKSRKAFDTVAAHVEPEQFTPTGAYWWKLLVTWYAQDPAASGVDFALFRDRGEREAGRNAELSVEWLEDLPEAPSPENVAWEVLELKRQYKYREMTGVFEGAADDRDKMLEVTREHAAMMEATQLEEAEEIRHGSTLEDLFNPEIRKKLPLFPRTLNEKTDGGASPGNHIIVFGRKESGKSLMAINLVAQWLRLGFRGCYLGNEEPINDIKRRIVTNLSGMNKAECVQYQEEAYRRSRAKGWDNLLAEQLFPGTPAQVEAIVKDWKPDFLILDQLRNMNHDASKGGTRAQSLDRIATAVRSILNRYQVVGVSLGQANAGDHGKQRLELHTDDFDESRTGVPGMSDAMIGMSYNDALDAHNQRYVSLPANKLSGDHTGFTIKFDKERNRIL